MDIKKIEQMGMEQGFSHVVLLDCDTIELKPEVRQMCAADTCHKYDKCWSCPPGCGSLEECEAKVRQYKYGIIVQTVGELEDAFDGEGMMETEARHKEYFVEFEKKLREIYPDMLAIGAGCCTKCKVCTYPDAIACGNGILACMSRDFGIFMPKHLAGQRCVNNNGITF